MGQGENQIPISQLHQHQDDNEHVAPVADQGADDRRLRENNDTLNDHPQHISDKRVVKVIFMHRIASPASPEVGRALIGSSCVGIAAGLADKDAIIAHEIGHLITGSQAHSTLPNNVLNDPGPGTDITEGQITAARTWARISLTSGRDSPSRAGLVS